MGFVSTRYQGASVNKDAFIFWLTQTLLWSLSWFSWTQRDKRFMSPCPCTPMSVGIVLSIYCPLFGHERACGELTLVFLVESSPASVAEHWAACSNFGGAQTCAEIQSQSMVSEWHLSEMSITLQPCTVNIGVPYQQAPLHISPLVLMDLEVSLHFTELCSWMI